MLWKTRARVAVMVTLLIAVVVDPVEAQLNTQHVKGTVGLKSGTQAPPGVYFIAPLFYLYQTDQVRDENGYQWETFARTTTQGSELTILATWLLKPLKLP